jgi:hypothetical protein
VRENLAGPEWQELVNGFETTAWRWEQQPLYASDVETGWFDRWLAGDRTPPDYVVDWIPSALAGLSEARTRTRVRVIDDPETPFQQWADWVADLSRAAGEVIHQLQRREAEHLDLIGDPLVDWWLLDDRMVLLLRFTPAGELYQVDLDDSDATLSRCRRIRDLAEEAVATSVIPTR